MCCDALGEIVGGVTKTHLALKSDQRVQCCGNGAAE